MPADEPESDTNTSSLVQIPQRDEMALTDTFIRLVKWSGAKAGDKHSDGGGLYLLISAVGKYWRLN